MALEQKNEHAFIEELNRIKLKNDQNWKNQCIAVLKRVASKQEEGDEDIIEAYVKYTEGFLPARYVKDEEKLKYRLYLKNSIGMLTPSELQEVATKSGVITPSNKRAIETLNEKIETLRGIPDIQQNHLFLIHPTNPKEFYRAPSAFNELAELKEKIDIIIHSIFQIDHERSSSYELGSFSNSKNGEDFAAQLDELRRHVARAQELHQQLKHLAEAGGEGDLFDKEFGEKINSFNVFAEHCQKINALIPVDYKIEWRLTDFFLSALMHVHGLLNKPIAILPFFKKLSELKRYYGGATEENGKIFHYEVCSSVASVCMASICFQAGDIQAGNEWASRIRINETGELDESIYIQRYNNYWNKHAKAGRQYYPDGSRRALLNFQKFHIGKYFLAKNPDGKSKELLFGLRCLYEAAFGQSQDQYSPEALAELHQFAPSLFPAEEAKGEVDEDEKQENSLQQKYKDYIEKLDCYLKTVVVLQKAIAAEEQRIKDNVFLSPAGHIQKLKALLPQLQALDDRRSLSAQAYLQRAAALKAEFDTACGLWESRWAFLKNGTLDNNLGQAGLAEYLESLEQWAGTPNCYRIDMLASGSRLEAPNQILFKKIGCWGFYEKDCDYEDQWVYNYLEVHCDILNELGQRQEVIYRFKAKEGPIHDQMKAALLSKENNLAVTPQMLQKHDALFKTLRDLCVNRLTDSKDNLIPYPASFCLARNKNYVQRFNSVIAHAQNNGWYQIADRARATLAILHFAQNDFSAGLELVKEIINLRAAVKGGAVGEVIRTLLRDKHLLAKQVYKIGEYCLRKPTAEYKYWGLVLLESVAISGDLMVAAAEAEAEAEAEAKAEVEVGTAEDAKDSETAGQGAVSKGDTVGDFAKILLLHACTSQDARDVIEGEHHGEAEEKDVDYSVKNISPLCEVYSRELGARIPWEAAFGPGTPFATTTQQLKGPRQDDLGKASSLQRSFWLVAPRSVAPSAPPAAEMVFQVARPPAFAPPAEPMPQETGSDFQETGSSETDADSPKTTSSETGSDSQETGSAEPSSSPSPSYSLPQVVAPLSTSPQAALIEIQQDCLRLQCISPEEKNGPPLKVAERVLFTTQLIGKVSALQTYLNAQLVQPNGRPTEYAIRLLAPNWRDTRLHTTDDTKQRAAFHTAVTALCAQLLALQGKLEHELRVILTPPVVAPSAPFGAPASAPPQEEEKREDAQNAQAAPSADVSADATPKPAAALDPNKKDEKAEDKEAEENFPEGVERAPVHDPVDGVGEVAPPEGAAVSADQPEQVGQEGEEINIEAGEQDIEGGKGIALVDPAPGEDAAPNAQLILQPQPEVLGEGGELAVHEDEEPGVSPSVSPIPREDEQRLDEGAQEGGVSPVAAVQEEGQLHPVQAHTEQMQDAQITQVQAARIAELEAVNAAQAERIAQLEGLLRGFMLLSAQAAQVLPPPVFSQSPSHVQHIASVVVANDREEKHAGNSQAVGSASLLSGVPVAVPVLQPSSAAGYSPSSSRFLVTPREAPLSEAVGSQVLTHT